MNQSRDLRERVVRALAKVGLVWALAVLGALFMAMSSQGLEVDGGYSLAADSVRTATEPSTAGLVLALLVLAGGLTVLAVGGARDRRAPVPPYEPEPELAMDLPLALGLVFGSSSLD